jgi:TRAP-type C4-dicarboxylate transport system substrate-binding protein
MLSDALRAAAQEAEELEKNQQAQETILNGHGARICELEDRDQKVRETLKKVKDSLYSVVLALDELEN